MQRTMCDKDDDVREQCWLLQTSITICDASSNSWDSARSRQEKNFVLAKKLASSLGLHDTTCVAGAMMNQHRR